jgi:hypothetical protein
MAMLRLVQLVDNADMSIFILFGCLLIFHIGVINGMSLITGRFKTNGLLLDNSFFWSAGHILGVLFLLLAGVAIYIGDRSDYFELSLVIGGFLMLLDLLIIGRFFVYGKK